jgi:hypothetical protein
MDLTYGQVEDLLARMHMIPPEHRGALRARLKHFKRLGFPPGVNTGSGRRAQYDMEALIKLLCAFEMLQLGISPERAAAMMNYFAPTLMVGADNLRASVLDPTTDEFLIIFDPFALARISDQAREIEDNSTKADEAFIKLPGSFFCALGSRHAQLIRRRRTAVINLSLVLSNAAEFLGQHEEITRSAFARALNDWADDMASKPWEPHP